MMTRCREETGEHDDQGTRPGGNRSQTQGSQKERLSAEVFYSGRNSLDMPFVSIVGADVGRYFHDIA